jgi:RND family efflux transporter MFP subunit
MIRKYFLPILAATGIGFGIFVALQDRKVTPPAAPVSEAPRSPYQSAVAGAGIVEASTENISIGTHVAGIVIRIDVQIGSLVKANDPLFTIDDRATLAELAIRKAAVQVAEAQLADSKNQLALEENMADKRAISVEDITKRRDTMLIAEAQLALAKAQCQSTQTDLERLTVRAPVDGQVLQLKIHPGEFAPTGVLQQPLLLLGNIQNLCVRVNIDENDAWRVKGGAAATGFLRGNRNIHTPLSFVRFEPYVIPKVSLTGDATERVDTRVLQVIYSFDRGELPIFVGQQMDVFIDSQDRKIASSPNRPL